MPWRKGPFSLYGVNIDTEWRSDWKWDRVLPHLSDLTGRTILDVGCGSGYHMWRMIGAGNLETGFLKKFSAKKVVQSSNSSSSVSEFRSLC